MEIEERMSCMFELRDDRVAEIHWYRTHAEALEALEG